MCVAMAAEDYPRDRRCGLSTYDIMQRAVWWIVLLGFAAALGMSLALLMTGG